MDPEIEEIFLQMWWLQTSQKITMNKFGEKPELPHLTCASTSIKEEDVLSDALLDKVMMFDWEWRASCQDKTERT